MDPMRRREFLIFVGGLLVSVFLLGVGAGMWVAGDPGFRAAVFSGLLINGVSHFFLWKKFWNHLKAMAGQR